MLPWTNSMLLTTSFVSWDITQELLMPPLRRVRELDVMFLGDRGDWHSVDFYRVLPVSLLRQMQSLSVSFPQFDRLVSIFRFFFVCFLWSFIIMFSLLGVGVGGGGSIFLVDPTLKQGYSYDVSSQDLLGYCYAIETFKDAINSSVVFLFLMSGNGLVLTVVLAFVLVVVLILMERLGKASLLLVSQLGFLSVRELFLSYSKVWLCVVIFLVLVVIFMVTQSKEVVLQREFSRMDTPSLSFLDFYNLSSWVILQSLTLFDLISSLHFQLQSFIQFYGLSYLEAHLKSNQVILFVFLQSWTHSQEVAFLLLPPLGVLLLGLNSYGGAVELIGELG